MQRLSATGSGYGVGRWWDWPRQGPGSMIILCQLSQGAIAIAVGVAAGHVMAAASDCNGSGHGSRAQRPLLLVTAAGRVRDCHSRFHGSRVQLPCARP